MHCLQFWGLSHIKLKPRGAVHPARAAPSPQGLQGCQPHLKNCILNPSDHNDDGGSRLDLHRFQPSPHTCTPRLLQYTNSWRNTGEKRLSRSISAPWTQSKTFPSACVVWLAQRDASSLWYPEPVPRQGGAGGTAPAGAPTTNQAEQHRAHTAPAPDAPLQPLKATPQFY